ncbi:MAG: lamin tail domain-containing protein [Patescibacteria group bacterium]|nr:lamin tail domain-containing protein [Patescibacteria group bacterium]
MKKIIIFILFLFLLFYFLNIKQIFAQSKILINEFLLEPQPQQVEIINIGTESADLKNWVIDDDGGSSSFYTIGENSMLYPNSCLVFSSNFYLNTKSSDTIRLFDDKNNLIDSFSYKASSGSGISFQRIPDGNNNWITASANIGFFNSSKNSCIFTTPTPTLTTIFPTINQTETTPAITPTPTTTPALTIYQTPIIQPISYENIFISEVMVNPLLNEKEWLEIFNNNNYPVYLNNWYIDDIENAGSSPKSFSLEIPAKGYKAIFLSTAVFNNSGDYVRLLDFNKNLKDSFEYLESKQNKTWGRINFENDNFCLQQPSLEEKNNSCLEPSPTLNNQSNQTKTTSNQNSTLTLTTKPTAQELKKTIKKNSRSFLNNQDQNTSLYNFNQGKILGIKDKINNNNNQKIIIFFAVNSFFYSFLTVILILIKIKILYGKIKKFLLSLIYTQ